MKNILKNLGISFIHIFVFFVLQIVMSMIFMVIGCINELMKHSSIIEQTISSNSENTINELTNITNEILMSPNVLSMVIYALLFSSILNILYFLIIFKMKKENPIKKVSNIDIVKYLGFGVLFNLMISCILHVIADIIPSSANSELEAMTSTIMSGNFFVVLLSVGILGPIVEELVFRYGIFKQLEKTNYIFAIIISSFLFGIMHMNLVQSTYAMLLGILFAFVYHKTNNLIYPILLHVGINSSSVIASKLFSSDWVGLGVCVSISLIAILVVVLFEMKSKKKQKNIKILKTKELEERI